MASDIVLKNNLETEFRITHSDDKPAKSLDTEDLTYTRATVADMEAISNPQDGDVCFVRDHSRGGSFIYDSSEVANDNQGTNFNGWIRQYSGAVNIKWFGADITGQTSSVNSFTSAMNYAVSIGSAIASWDGIILFDSSINLLEGTKIKGGKTSSIKLDTSLTLSAFSFTGTRLNHLKDILIDGVKLIVEDDVDAVLLRAYWVDNVTLTNNYCIGAGLTKLGEVEGTPDHDTYDSITSISELNTNIKIEDNYIIGQPNLAYTNVPIGIFVRYVADISISNNRTYYCGMAGILVWGLDADVTRGKGYPGEKRWTSAVNIIGNIGLKNVASHIFCMGCDDVTVSGNKGNYSTDVGIDLEGCTNSIVNANTVKNCKNGNFSQFLYSTNVTWSNNVSIADDEVHTVRNTTYTVLRLFLDSISTIDTTDRTLKLIDNTFVFNPTTSTPSFLLPVSMNNSDSWEVRGNTFINSIARATTGSGDGIRFNHNKFELRVNPLNNYNMLEVSGLGNFSNNGEFPAEIVGNKFVSYITQTGDSRTALNINFDSFTNRTIIVKDNICNGFPVSLIWKAGSPSGGRFIIKNNYFSGNVFDLTSASRLLAGQGRTVWIENYTLEGKPFWITTYGKPRRGNYLHFQESYEVPTDYLSVVSSGGNSIQGNYSNVTGYPYNVQVAYSGKIYRSLKSFPNLGNQPDISPTFWEEIGTTAAVFYKAGAVSTVAI